MTQSHRAAVLSGVVTRSPNGEPAAGATVKLVDEPPSTAPAGRQLKSTTAGADGSFRFDDVEPRAYWIVANLQGFLPGEYGQRSPTGTGTSFTVTAGQRATSGSGKDLGIVRCSDDAEIIRCSVGGVDLGAVLVGVDHDGRRARFGRGRQANGLNEGKVSSAVHGDRLPGLIAHIKTAAIE